MTDFKHAKITGQEMRDHWGPIVDRIANEMSDSMSQHCPNCEAQAAEIERLREALLSCPLIARYETAEKFRERQDDWLATTYREALAGKEHLK